MSLTPAEIERMDAALRAKEGEDAFWQARHTEFLEKYPDQFVAVSDGEVVATSPDLLELEMLLKSKGLDTKDVWIEFIDANPDRMIIL
jgi:hypothetical protein